MFGHSEKSALSRMPDGADEVLPPAEESTLEELIEVTLGACFEDYSPKLEDLLGDPLLEMGPALSRATGRNARNPMVAEEYGSMPRSDI